MRLLRDFASAVFAAAGFVFLFPATVAATTNIALANPPPILAGCKCSNNSCVYNVNTGSCPVTDNGALTCPQAPDCNECQRKDAGTQSCSCTAA